MSPKKSATNWFSTLLRKLSEPGCYNLPPWLEILAAPVSVPQDPSLADMDSGERAAIILAESLRADLLLIDDRAGANLALQRGLAVTGTLGVLDLASRAQLLRLRDAFARLQKTNFRYPPSLMELLLEEERARSIKDV